MCSQRSCTREGQEEAGRAEEGSMCKAGKHSRILRDTNLFRSKTSERCLRQGDRREGGLKDAVRNGPSGFSSDTA